MAYDFYVMQGKKLIDYKPRKEHYERAFLKYAEKIINGELTEDEEDKILFLYIKILGRMDSMRGKRPEKVYEAFCTIEFINDIMSRKTPRKIMQMFPITKEYDGEKSGWKDYFYVMRYIESIGIDNAIGENVLDFIMEYMNIDIQLFAVMVMGTTAAMSIIENGTDPLMEFLEENGAHPKTFYQDGNEMVDSETGERFKIVKPKNPLRKLFSIV